MIDVSGVRSSWETRAENSSFIRSASRLAVTSLSTTIRPCRPTSTSLRRAT